jgi:glucokinase-like ROK family protein
MARRLGADQLASLASVLDSVRFGRARTRAEIGQLLGYGRSIVAERVSQLLDAGLLEDGLRGSSTGGRAPQELRFASERGHLLVAALGARGLSVGIADLAGSLVASREERHDIATGPEQTLGLVEGLIDDMLATRGSDAPPIWGLGIGIPGPVEFASGRPVAPPIMPGWDGYRVRTRLSDRYQVPVWVDNDVNLMALGELRAGLAQDHDDVLYIKIGTGVGAGVICAGQLHRGAQGAAGDVGHIAIVEDSSIVCRCGNTGCLEALAGGGALAREGAEAARAGLSGFLSERLQAAGELEARDITDAAEHGDAVAVELLSRSGRLVGEALAMLVNFYNPSLIIIGGGLANDLVLASIRQAVYRRSLPLATRHLQLVRSPIDRQIGLRGAAYVVLDQLFAPGCLAEWIGNRSPTGDTAPALAGAHAFT